MDGSIVSIVSIKTDEKGREIKGGRRKHRELSWREAHRCVARDPRSVTGIIELCASMWSIFHQAPAMFIGRYGV